MSHHVSAIDKVPDGINVDEVVYELFPNLRPIVDGINTKTAELKKLVGKMMEAFDRLVKANVSDLNSQLESLGIPYAFVLDLASREERTAGYRLVHTNAEKPAMICETPSRMANATLWLCCCFCITIKMAYCLLMTQRHHTMTFAEVRYTDISVN